MKLKYMAAIAAGAAMAPTMLGAAPAMAAEAVTAAVTGVRRRMRRNR